MCVCVLVCLSEYIKLHPLKWYIFINIRSVRADPDLDVVRRSFRQLPTEPGRVVELTARVPCATPLPIPERIIGVKYAVVSYVRPCFTEVVLADKLRNENSASVSAGTRVSAVACFANCGSKGPDVLTRRAMCDADAVNVIIIYGCVDSGTAERPSSPKLVPNEFPTHTSVANAVRGEES